MSKKNEGEQVISSAALTPKPKFSERHPVIYGFFAAIFGLIIFVCVILFVGNVWNLIDASTGYNAPFFGQRASVIVSDSMSFVNPSNKDDLEDYPDRIYKNDLVLANDDFTFDSLKEGDVILVRNENIVICHRLIQKFVDEKTGEQMIVTRGDANSNIDTPWDYDDVIGRVYYVIPGIGRYVLFFQSAYGLLAICACVMFLCLGALASSVIESRRIERCVVEYNAELSTEMDKQEAIPLPAGSRCFGRTAYIATKGDLKSGENLPF